MSGTVKHAANEDAAWRAVTCEPDFCRVGKHVIGFDSSARLDQAVTASPDVSGDGHKLYRVGDTFRSVQGDVGQHIVSGTSQGSGYTRILSGQDNVKVNGKPLARDSSACRINCDANGTGGAKGYLTTETKAAQSNAAQNNATSDKSAERSMLQRMGDESGKVLKDKAHSLWESAKTLWQALPGTSEAAVTQAARARIAEGIGGAVEGVGTLMGPSPQMVNAAYISGDAKAIALVQQMQARQSQAVGTIIGSIGQSVREAAARSGTAGAIAMIGTTIGTEILGGKGAGAAAGALANTGSRIVAITRTAQTPLEAARLLDAELSAARAAGKSAEQIALLERARQPLARRRSPTRVRSVPLQAALRRDRQRHGTCTAAPLINKTWTHNPVGCGIAPDVREAARGLVRLPNVESIEHLISGPGSRPAPIGFGPIASHWQPRRRYAGTCDKAWQQHRSPLLPEDLDPRHWQAAPPEQQVIGYLKGGEPVALVHLTPSGFAPNGRIGFTLPRVTLAFETRFRDGSVERSRSVIHSVTLEPDVTRVSVVHHMSLPCHPKVNLLERTIVREKRRPLQRAGASSDGDDDTAASFTGEANR